MQRQQQAEARREQFLEEALTLFAEKGVEGTTTRDLAEATGSAPGLVYHYFENKEHLLKAVIDRHSFLPQLQTILQTDSQQPTREVLSRIAHNFHAALAANDKLLRVLFRELQTNPIIAARFDEMISIGVSVLGAYLAERIEAKELRPHDTATTARTLFYSTLMLRITHTPADPFILNLIDMMLNGLTLERTNDIVSNT